MKKIVVILGPTATGKSDLAVEIAHKINGEIISADSRQVYKGLDIGTGKITKKEMQGVPHYLLDVASPKKRFTVAEYKILTEKAIEKILRSGKTPIICGGTGFYIDTVIKGIVLPEVPPNEKLRETLNKKNNLQLFKILEKLDKERAENIDKNNKVRLVRAIEIAKVLGKVPKVKKSTPPYKFIKIGLTLPNKILDERIKNRLAKRLDMGMINEIKGLHDKGLSWKRMQELGLEYRYVSLFLEKKISKEEMFNRLNSEICKYAKRQMTWFKRDKDIFWFNASSEKLAHKTINLLNKKA